MTGAYRERNSTADRALDILTMFSDTDPVVSGTAVAHRLGVSRSTAYRYLQSLVATRFLEEAPGGGFRLGLRVLEIARLARRSYGLSEIAMAAITQLAEETGETVLLTRRTGDLVVCLERAEAREQTVRISYERGSILPINAGASAQVLLAWNTAEDVRRLLASTSLRRFTPTTLTDVDALMQRLSVIREAGYAITHAEFDPNVLGIAAPVRDDSGAVVAAVSVAALAYRVTPGAERGIISAVLSTAHAISDRMAVVAG